MTRKILLGAILAALVVGGATWTAAQLSSDAEGLPKGAVSAAYISGREEATLFFPGAEAVPDTPRAEFVYCETCPAPAHSAATATASLTTGASVASVLAWYGQQLTRRGWRRGGEQTYGGPGTKLQQGNTRTVTFRRGGREVFVVTGCEGCPESDAGHFTIAYSIAPFACRGQYSCGQMPSFSLGT